LLVDLFECMMMHGLTKHKCRNLYFGVEVMFYMIILTLLQQYFDSCARYWWAIATVYSGWHIL